MKTAIFGAGQGGAMASRWIPGEVVCFMDNNPACQNTESDHIPVLSLEAGLKLSPDLILIAVLNQEAAESIRKQIEASGYHGSIETISSFRKLQDLRLAELRLAAGQIRDRNVPGDTAELGVYQGAFAREINRCFPDRKLYLLDTFEGFAEADLKHETGGTYRNDFSDTSIELVRQKLPHPEQAVFVKGHFPESASGLPETSYAFVSLDPDLSAGAEAGLEYFWPRLSKGGVIILHDYTSLQYPGVREAADRFCRKHGLYLIPLADLHGSAVFLKQGGEP